MKWINCITAGVPVQHEAKPLAKVYTAGSYMMNDTYLLVLWYLKVCIISRVKHTSQLSWKKVRVARSIKLSNRKQSI